MSKMLCPIHVGRSDELLTLTDAVARARSSKGSAVVVSGAAGIGKSRLLREVQAIVRDRGSTVLVGRATAGLSTPFRPIAEAVLAWARNQAPPDSPDLRPFRGALGRLIPGWADRESAAEDDSLLVLAEAVLRLMREAGAGAGCVLILEDLHWADAETLGVVEYLADNIASEPVALLISSRPEEGREIEALGKRLEERGSATVLTIRPLDAEDARSMARACLAADDLDPDVASLLDTWAEGVPLLVEELLASLVAAQALVRAGDRWVVAGPLRAAVPAGFREGIGRRLAALGPDTRTVLRAAAVLGRRFRLNLLPGITGLEPTDALDHLRRGLDAQLLVPDGAGFRFHHALTRDAVLEDMLPPERAEMSKRALDLLMREEGDDSGARTALAAELAEAAGETEQACMLLLLAGRRAIDAGALRSAEGFLSRARSLDPADAELAVGVIEALVHTLSLAGKKDQALDAGAELLRLLGRLAAPAARFAHAHVMLARAAAAANSWREASEQIEAAQRASARAGDPAVTARVGAQAALVAMGRRRPDDAEALARSALAEAELSGEIEAACEALEVIGRCARRNDLDAAREAFERALSIAEENGLVLWRIRALHEVATIEQLRAYATDKLVEARELAIASDALATATVIDLQLASAYGVRGEPEAALEAAGRCIETAKKLGLAPVQASALIHAAIGHMLLGRRDRMRQALREALAIGPDDPDVLAGAWGYCRGTASLLDEERQRAFSELETAMEFVRTSPLVAPWPSCGLWALLAMIEGRGGLQAREELAASGFLVQRVNRGLLSFADAVALGREGRRAEAEEAVAEGDAIVALNPWIRNIARRLLAEVALRDGWGEPVAWLREAAAYFEANGHDRILAACRSLLRRAGAPLPRRAPSDADGGPLRGLGLTRREIEVLDLVGEGASNADIASRLYLSPRTVEKHLASLRAKTSCESRAQLIAFAARTRRDR